MSHLVARAAIPVFGVFIVGVLTYWMPDASAAQPRPMTCEMSGAASLTRDYGNLQRGDVLTVSVSLNFSGKIGVSYSEPLTESGKMLVTHANGSTLESSISHVNTWDRKTSGTSFMTRIHGPYIQGNIGGISGPAPTRTGVGWRPGIEFFGETAGSTLDGRYPVSTEDWNLLPRRILTLPNPNNENSIMQVARFSEMTFDCKYKN